MTLLERLSRVDIVPLTMSLVHLTGDLSLLEDIAPFIRGPWDYSHSVPDELADAIRARAAGELARVAAGGAPRVPTPPADVIRRMMSVAVGEEVPAEYVPMLLHQMAFAPERSVEAQEADARAYGFRVLVIGAGVSGLAAAIKLGEAGIPYVILEKNDHLGGTWYENRYPGCAVDTPNHFYQFSFEPNNRWPGYYSRRESIYEYLNHCADKFDVRPNILFQQEACSATYDERSHVWRVTSRDRGGRETVHVANVMICAVGQLNRPAVPRFPGLDRFRGDVVHTAAWSEDTKVDGKRVALVGTGASAIQVGPAIVDRVASLHVLQRSGSWIVRSPNVHREVEEEKIWALDAIPFYASWYRFQLFWGFADGLFQALKVDPAWSGGAASVSALNERYRQAMLRYMSRQLHGRQDLLEKVTPNYPPFGKRVLADPGWFAMLRRDHVSLVTSGIERIEEDGLRFEDGSFVRVDTIVLATGFQAGRMLWPMEIRGRGGHSIRDAWGDDDPRAYLGITVPDFPNLFVLYGPNTNLGHGGSAIFLAECQVRYIMGVLRAMIRNGLSEVECRTEVFEEYNRLIDEKFAQLVWTHPSVKSWYKNAGGRITTNQPWRLVDYWKMTREPNLSDYRTQPVKREARH